MWDAEGSSHLESYRMGQKSKPPTFGHLFAKYWPIFEILSHAHSVENCNNATIYFTTPQLRRYTTLWNINARKTNNNRQQAFLKWKRHQTKIAANDVYSLLDPPFWISGVLNEVFVSGLLGLVGLTVHPQWSRSLQYARVLVCRSHAFGRCFLLPEPFSVKCLVFLFVPDYSDFWKCMFYMIVRRRGWDVVE